MKPRKKRRGLTLAEIPIRDHGVCGNFECGKILPCEPSGGRAGTRDPDPWAGGSDYPDDGQTLF